MREAIESAKRENDRLAPRTTDGPTSLTPGSDGEDEIREFLELLPAFREADPILSAFCSKLDRDPDWRPSFPELASGTAAMREAKRRQRRAESVDGLIEIETGMDLPSSLDDESFDLLD